jgi:hypothetical protein
MQCKITISSQEGGDVRPGPRGRRHSGDDMNERIPAAMPVQSPFPAFASSRSLNAVLAPTKARLEPVGKEYLDGGCRIFLPRLKRGVFA